MTDQKKRRRPRSRRGGGGGAASHALSADAVEMTAPVTTPSGRVIPPLPVWRWRTFPVYFAMTGGLFVGLYIGIAVGGISANTGNDVPMTAVLIIAALAFGFALSRMTSRIMVTRGIFRPKAKPKP